MSWLALACTGTTDVPVSVEQRVSEVRSAGTQGGAAVLVSSDDPVEIELVMRALARADATLLSGLCGDIPDPLLRERCTTLSQRPHLTTEVPAHVPGGGAQQQEQGATSPLAPPEGVGSIDLDTAADRQSTVPDCAPEEAAHTCAIRLRDTAAYGIGAQGVFDACSHEEQPAWRSECLFQGASVLLYGEGTRQLRGATDLCLESDGLAPTCLHHLVESLVKRADREAGGLRIVDLEQITSSVRAEWAERSPEYGDLLADLCWSIATWALVVDSDQPEAALQGTWPAEAWPHIRAALALRLVELRAPGTQQLGSGARLLADLEAAIAAAPTQPSPLPSMAEHNRPAADLWSTDAPAEGTTAIFYVGTSQRSMHADPATDRQLALLEAAARNTHSHHLLVQARVHGDPTVQHTAARLTAAGRTQGRATQAQGAHPQVQPHPR